jgi:hypothetical protein
VEVWQHRPQNGVIESLEWLTDVIRCKSAEYRLCLRQAPRQTFSLQHQMDEAEYGLAREKARKVGGDPLFVPDWPRLTVIPAIAAGTTAIPVDAAHASAVQVDSSVLLWESFTKFEVCIVTEIGDGTIGIEATTQAYTYVVAVPLRVGTFAQPFANTRYAAKYTTEHALFVVTATEDMNDLTAVAYPTYLDKPLVTSKREMINAVEDTTERVCELFDSKISGLVNYPLHTTPRTAMNISLTAQTAQERIDLRTFLATLCGRWKSFYLPSGNADFTLTKDITAGDGFIQVAAVDFVNTYGLGTDIALLSMTGAVVAIRVTSVTTEVAGSERLRFAGAFSGGMPMTTVDKVSKLILSRLDADRIELQYIPGLALTVSVLTQEVPA